MSNLISQLLESAQPDHLVIILDESGRWYNQGVAEENFGPLQSPVFFEELWPDVVQDVMRYCMRAVAAGLSVSYVSSGEDAFLLTTSPAKVVKQWLAALATEPS
jgi:hypothetical protein